MDEWADKQIYRLPMTRIHYTDRKKYKVIPKHARKENKNLKSTVDTKICKYPLKGFLFTIFLHLLIYFLAVFYSVGFINVTKSRAEGFNISNNTHAQITLHG